MEKKLESPANGIGRSRRKTSQIASEKLKAQLEDESSDDETGSISSGTGYETNGSFVTDGSGSSENESESSSPARTYSSGYRSTVNKSDTSDTDTDSDNEDITEGNLPSSFIEPFPKRTYQKKSCRFPERPEASLCEERESRALETSIKNVHEKKQEKTRENPARFGMGESRGRGIT